MKKGKPQFLSETAGAAATIEGLRKVILPFCFENGINVIVADCGHQVHYKSVLAYIRSKEVVDKWGYIRVIPRSFQDRKKLIPKLKKQKKFSVGISANSYEFNTCDTHVFAHLQVSVYDKLEATMTEEMRENYCVHAEKFRMRAEAKKFFKRKSTNTIARNAIFSLPKTFKKIKKRQGGRVYV